MENLFVTLFVILIYLSPFIFIIWYLLVGKKKSQEKINNFTRNFNNSTNSTATLLNSTLQKTKKNIERKVSKSYLTGCSWILTSENNENILFTFRSNNELLITTNGIVKKALYEFIVDNNSILMTKDDVTEHYNILNVKDDFLFLNKVSSDKILFLANYTKFKDEIKSTINQLAIDEYKRI